MRVTVFPETGLPPTSSSVTVIVEVEPSVLTPVGFADTVDSLALTAPRAIETLPLVPVLPFAEAVKVTLEPTGPVYTSSPARVATPFEKSPAWFRTAPPLRPETTPDGDAEIVTWFAEASKFVIVLPYWSFAVTVFVPVKAMPSVCEPEETSKWSSAAGVIVTDGRAGDRRERAARGRLLLDHLHVCDPVVVLAVAPGPLPVVSP